MAGNRRKDLLRKLFGGAREEAPAEEAVESAQNEEQPTAAPEPPAMTEEERAARLEVEGGALLRVWRRWKGEDASPPVLSLSGKPGDQPLPLIGEKSIERERLRLKTQLEKDAKQRLQEIEANDQKEGTGALNASCRVYLSQYAMVAWVFIFPPTGESGTMQMDDVGKALQASGVTSGVDSTAVLHLVQNTAFFELIPIARGTAPVEGSDGTVTERYSREVQKEVKVDETGNADYRSTTYVQLIQKGDVICDITLPVEGQAGVRVDGKVVEAKKVHPAKVPAGSNTVLSEDGTQLVATIDGHLLFSNGLFMVRPLLDIAGDVDYSTGNIDYRGDVHIHGDVRENFFVRATGTVTVDGTVEAANIEAGGDLIVSSGVMGDNRATIKSGGCIRVKYLDSCVAYASKGVYADCIMSSQVNSDDAICVATGRGTIIGGSMTAARLIRARMVGSQSGMKTGLTLGILPYNREKIRNAKADLKTVSQEMEDLSKDLIYLEEQQDMGVMDEKLAKARLRKSVLIMKENQLLKVLEEEAGVRPDLTKCRLESDTVYPGTSLKIEEDTWRVNQVKKNCKVGYNVNLCCIEDK